MHIRLPCVLVVTLTAVALLPAEAQDFPAGPVRFVVPLPPGGTMDIIARTVGAPTSRALGQNVLL